MIMAFNPQNFLSGLGGLFGGMFGNTSAPYDREQEEYQKWANKGQQVQQPYSDAGKTALGDYQNWLNGQKDPSGFINQMMGQYKESPYAQNLQRQAMLAGQNAGSANGTLGSTPLMQQMQQNAGNIASADQQNWLSNVLGVNTQYGQGQHNLVQGGQNSANKLTDMYNDMGGRMGQSSYNREASKNNNFWNSLGGIGSMIGSFF